MADPVQQLAAMIDAKARRLQRDAADLRRLAARLRDTVSDQDTAPQEDTRADTTPS